MSMPRTQRSGFTATRPTGRGVDANGSRRHDRPTGTTRNTRSRAQSRSRRTDNRPYYARLLRLRHVNPGGLLCFLLAEGVIALAVLMALAELVNWWAVPLLPLVVAGLVKINDIIAGMFARAERRYVTSRPPRARGVAKVRGVAAVIPMASPAEQSWPNADRQSEATHRVRTAPPRVDYVPAGGPDGSPTESRAGGRRRAKNQRPFVPVMPSRTSEPPRSDSDW